MGGHRRRARWAFAALMVVAIVAGACSSPGVAVPTTTSGPRVPAGSTGRGALVAAGAPVPSPGCSGSGSGEGSAPLTEARQDITVDGVARWYLLTTPPTHLGSGPLPLVVDLHGLAEGATLHADTTQFSPEAQASGFIVVFPEGTGTPVSWNIAPPTSAHPNHDIDFINAMVDALEKSQCVDQSRLYATGFSDGALFTSLLACTMANRFAAFAPVAGVVVPSSCDPGRKVPILAFHGTADPILYFNGGIGTAVLNHALGGGPAPTTTTPPPVNLNGKGYPANVKAWAAKDGCNLQPTDHKVSAHVILRTYRCPSGAAVEFYMILGGGHAWPGSKVSASLASITGPSTFEIDATAIIWTFFRQHRLNS